MPLKLGLSEWILFITSWRVDNTFLVISLHTSSFTSLTEKKCKNSTTFNSLFCSLSKTLYFYQFLSWSKTSEGHTWYGNLDSRYIPDQNHKILNAMFTLKNAAVIAQKFRHFHVVVVINFSPSSFKQFHQEFRENSKGKESQQKLWLQTGRQHLMNVALFPSFRHHGWDQIDIFSLMVD